jgi:hypothetical protein
MPIQERKARKRCGWAQLKSFCVEYNVVFSDFVLISTDVDYDVRFFAHLFGKSIE